MIYKLTIAFRNIYRNINKDEARADFIYWKEHVVKSKIEEFNTVVNSVEYHLEIFSTSLITEARMQMPNLLTLKLKDLDIVLEVLRM